jgi:hypothetical protein
LNKADLLGPEKATEPRHAAEIHAVSPLQHLHVEPPLAQTKPNFAKLVKQGEHRTKTVYVSKGKFPCQ